MRSTWRNPIIPELENLTDCVCCILLYAFITLSILILVFIIFLISVIASVLSLLNAPNNATPELDEVFAIVFAILFCISVAFELSLTHFASISDSCFNLVVLHNQIPVFVSSTVCFCDILFEQSITVLMVTLVICSLSILISDFDDAPPMINYSIYLPIIYYLPNIIIYQILYYLPNIIYYIFAELSAALSKSISYISSKYITPITIAIKIIKIIKNINIVSNSIPSDPILGPAATGGG